MTLPRKAIEAGARAIALELKIPFEKNSVACRDYATACLTTGLAAEGMVLLPREPDDAMSAAGRKAVCALADRMETAKITAASSSDFWQQVGHKPADEVYRAMLSAYGGEDG